MLIKLADHDPVGQQKILKGGSLSQELRVHANSKVITRLLLRKTLQRRNSVISRGRRQNRAAYRNELVPWGSLQASPNFHAHVKDLVQTNPAANRGRRNSYHHHVRGSQTIVQ